MPVSRAEKGDLVRLNIGGTPIMLVTAALVRGYGSDEVHYCECAWDENGTLKIKEFDQVVLKVVRRSAESL